MVSYEMFQCGIGRIHEKFYISASNFNIIKYQQISKWYYKIFLILYSKITYGCSDVKTCQKLYLCFLKLIIAFLPFFDNIQSMAVKQYCDNNDSNNINLGIYNYIWYPFKIRKLRLIFIKYLIQGDVLGNKRAKIQDQAVQVHSWFSEPLKI